MENHQVHLCISCGKTQNITDSENLTKNGSPLSQIEFNNVHAPRPSPFSRKQDQKVAEVFLDAGNDFVGVEMLKGFLAKWGDVVGEWFEVVFAGGQSETEVGSDKANVLKSKVQSSTERSLLVGS